MTQQVLGRSRAVGEAVAAVARAVGTPGPRSFADLHTVSWPVHDAESLRGAALLAESRLSAERPERLLVDHHRLFVGDAHRPPVAPPAPPATSGHALAGLLGRVGIAGPPDLAAALHAYAVLLEAPHEHGAARHELVHDHLLTWGTRCLSRAQLGAQSFCYQGVATLGLGLLRYAAAG
ncbi:chaperone TorD involved in molybdoenzyme TorA maturation [Georgenia satyanarayanai]|uniref:Chaperone TorD involved in molybdoenzyme TorA maturation n=1 Tax=Georgenia satyanarayanai TaxID=860221 RepID=A0A2Y9BYT7_9MICO|nr:hypothetical protein [Georgenia satyanarayanai]PYF99330.1 TorA maturation chaperone TorD [Georgenia satyanarayanai]SSA43142.1 chaperone TorD involved in molybdoenzyme TorA maturation [Georgenia satyanarayanai]